MFSTPEILSRILLARFSSESPCSGSCIFHFHISFSFAYLYLFSIHFQILNLYFNFLQLFVCVFLDYFKGFIHCSHKKLYHILKKVISKSLFFICVSIFTATIQNCQVLMETYCLGCHLLCFYADICLLGFRQIIIQGTDIWSSAFIPCFLLCFLVFKECGSCVLPNRQHFWDSNMCGHWMDILGKVCSQLFGADIQEWMKAGRYESKGGGKSK